MARRVYPRAMFRAGAPLFVGLLGACTAFPGQPLAAPQHPPAELEGCRAETYDFVGRGTLNSLRILHPDRAEASTAADVPGVFWVPRGVTRQYERDDGQTEEVRVFCAQLDDGGTLVNLPVARGWQPPP